MYHGEVQQQHCTTKCPHLQLWPGQDTCLRAKGWELRCAEDNNVPNMQGIQTGLFLCPHTWLQTCQPHCSQLRLHKAEEWALVLELAPGCCPREKSSCAFTCTWGLHILFFQPDFCLPKCFSSHTSMKIKYDPRPQASWEVITGCMCTCLCPQTLLCMAYVSAGVGTNHG